ncbi:HNH endonuclease [Corynebacterium pyruviciproducens]|uniref:HNH endonuclease n=1 Tax=Corynebacterium pyruviciproducens TaxID=598660 RepID=UPI0030B848EF
MLFASDKKVMGMARAGTVCCEAGCPQIAVYKGRCEGHARQVERKQRLTVPTKRTLTSSEARRRKAVVEAWRRKYGNVCPGFGRSAHIACDLTADHIIPIAAGGAPGGRLSVLCRSCNSRKGARLADGKQGGNVRKNA